MATPAGGKPFEPGLIERVAAGIRYTFTGQQAPWFGPNDPLPPQAPPEVMGRPIDFPVGVNLNYRPRSEQGDNAISFETLRRAADPVLGGLDLLRIAIETRKDQMEAQKWTIRGRDGKDGGDRAKNLETALRYPDLVHTYRQWARQAWEDLLVIDAPAFYLRPMPDGFRIPEIMDGALIKRLIDPNGRTPLPPEPAYQQILKGLPANNYTLDDLRYCPRNLRSNRFYGMSPVEQVVNIINLGLKRQMHLTAYYTDGNIPDQLIACPPTWQPDQVKQAQEWIDTILAGNLKMRRRMIMIPGGMEPKALKDPKLKDELDEWLARVICWVFSLPPSALVKEVNRATAETAHEQGHQEGLEPLKEWWADVMNDLILRCWGAEDLEFAWKDEEISDAKVKAEVLSTYVAAKIITPDEARDDLGKKPLTTEQKNELNPPPPPGLGGDGLEAAGAGKPGAKPATSQGGDRDSASGLPPAQPKDDSEKLEKKKTLPALNRNRPAVRRATRRIQKGAAAYFNATRRHVLASLKAEKLAKADLSREELMDILASLPEEERDQFLALLKQELGVLASDGSDQALAQVFELMDTMSEDAMDAMLSQANEKAIVWAEKHAADLVTRIDETTREGINDLVGTALQEGWSNDELASAIQDAEGFSDYRCEMIARTETAFADIQGNLAGFRESGVVEGKQWMVSQDEVCDDCTGLDGVVVGLDSEFPGGDPPLHPNCRCDVLPVLTQPNEEE